MSRSLVIGLLSLVSVQTLFAQEPDEAVNASAAERAPVHHSLTVTIDPYNNRLEVTDRIDLPESFGRSDIAFALNANLNITNRPRGLRETGSVSAEPAQGINETGGLAVSAARYSVDLPRRRGQPLELSYSGTLFDETRQTGAQYSQSFSETSGIIDSRGVYLNRGSAWIPAFGDELVTFEMQVQFADSARGWQSISQGDRDGDNGWRSDVPMEEVYLIAAAFTEYTSTYQSVLASDGNPREVDVLALLRTPDSNLAAKYLDATERYLALYEPLLGAYPYSKFALVENFWETGYGMPSFTLLGEQIIRFPFIIDSSYPHEILHNWWGNGVYPDYESGNWSEGLTAYLADHLFQEVEGRGPEYRKEMLARVKNYVSEAADFPLEEFTSRNSAASQAIGYGKTLMLWHMLRLELGDELFVRGLKQFYRDFQFKRASFSDIATHFSALAERDLQPFFTQWVTRKGAPEIAVSVLEERGDKARLMFAQIQDEAPFAFTVPVALYYAGSDVPQLVDVTLSQRAEGFLADNYSSLEAVVVDPYYDLFRTLDRAETPPTIGELFGASTMTFVVPSAGAETRAPDLENADTALTEEQWRELATNFGEGVNARIVRDDEIESLPADSSVWVLGINNRFADVAIEAASGDVSRRENGLSLGTIEIDLQDRSSVFVTRHPSSDELALGFIAIDSSAAQPGLIEKLPHYGKYSYLSFLGDAPTNDVKGVWASSESPLVWHNPERTTTRALASLPPVPALAELPPKYLQANLARHIEQLTAAAMLGRGITNPLSSQTLADARGAIGEAEQDGGIEEAARYIQSEFRRIGLKAIGGSYLQTWQDTLAGGRAQQLSNIVGLIPGSDPTLAHRPVVLGAHYDHLGLDERGVPFPGADDNASGVAVLIEVAAKLQRAFTPVRPIVIVAFSGEEAGLLGSKHFVSSPPRALGEVEFYAMLNLDAVGRLEGRKLQVFGSESAYEWPFMAQGIGYTIGVESQLPAQTIASSDHVSFLNNGVPAIHLFSGLHTDYHRVSDSAVKIDYKGLSAVASWLEEAAIYLGQRTDPLRVTLANAPIAVAPSGSEEPRASLGTVPDFAYVGEGVRITGVTPGSAAETAGLSEGDIILSLNGKALNDLQTYSTLLRTLSIGDEVLLELRRGGEVRSISATLTARR